MNEDGKITGRKLIMNRVGGDGLHMTFKFLRHNLFLRQITAGAGILLI
jgi:hypothetical protein